MPTKAVQSCYFILLWYYFADSGHETNEIGIRQHIIRVSI